MQPGPGRPGHGGRRSRRTSARKRRGREGVWIWSWWACLGSLMVTEMCGWLGRGLCRSLGNAPDAVAVAGWEAYSAIKLREGLRWDGVIVSKLQFGPDLDQARTRTVLLGGDKKIPTYGVNVQLKSSVPEFGFCGVQCLAAGRLGIRPESQAGVPPGPLPGPGVDGAVTRPAKPAK